jgi:type II secretory pathway pseudopilin PulG
VADRGVRILPREAAAPAADSSIVSLSNAARLVAWGRTIGPPAPVRRLLEPAAMIHAPAAQTAARSIRAARAAPGAVPRPLHVLAAVARRPRAGWRMVSGAAAPRARRAVPVSSAFPGVPASAAWTRPLLRRAGVRRTAWAGHAVRAPISARADASGPGEPAQAAPGFTLIEAVVALGLVAVALASLAPVLGRSARLLADARDETQAVHAAASRIQMIRALAWDADALTGLPRSDLVSDLSSEPPSAAGTGLAAGSIAALLSDVPGFADLLDRNGVPLGPAAAAAPGAMYLRRWTVRHLSPSLGPDLVAAVVVVRPLAAERRDGPRPSLARRPGDAWLFTVRARSRQ